LVIHWLRLEPLGTDHIPIEMNVKNLQSIENTFDKIKKNFSIPPTIIVNNAGITKIQNLLKVSEKDFDEVMDVNLKGPYFVMQAAVKAIINANTTEEKSIINVSSMVSKIGSTNHSHYAASKGGLNALTKAAAIEFAG
jgi:NAD(P)-dependent dehydrogenase (short-subunit alcohol dehydrogenase family)